VLASSSSDEGDEDQVGSAGGGGGGAGVGSWRSLKRKEGEGRGRRGPLNEEQGGKGTASVTEGVDTGTHLVPVDWNCRRHR